MDLQDILDTLFKDNLISFADFELYKNIKKETSSEILGILALVVNFSLKKGDSCIELDDVAQKDLCKILECDENMDGYRLPDYESLIDEIKGIKSILRDRVFFLYNNRMLFFRRIYDYEKRVAGILREIAKNNNGIKVKSTECEGCDFWQKVASAIAATNNLLIISGGPGTGKTTTIKSIVKNLEGYKTVVCAPTGKAVSRLIESLKYLVDRRGLEEPMTIHRLLRANDKLTRFFYNEENRLPYDVVIVDEASMVNLEMAYRLLSSLKTGSKLILIGDKDQLASVETGSVLNEICSFKDRLEAKNLNIFSKDFMADIENEHKQDAVFSDKIENPIVNCSVELIKNFRFGEKSGIGELSKAIRTDDIPAVESIIKKGRYEDLIFEENPGGGIIERITKEYKRIVEKDVSGLFKAVKVLTPLRVSRWGSIKINDAVDKNLKRVLKASNQWYEGREVIINVNDYQNNLFNGDIGVCVNRSGRVVVEFQKSDRERFYISPSLLPSYELAFAMSVHKSQGSEFDIVYFMLGPQTKILTKELIYTAITRAKSRIYIIGSKKAFMDGIKNKTKRKSALGDILYGNI